MDDTAGARARAWSLMKTAGAFYVFGSIAHTLDHFRRGAGSVSWEVVQIGTLGLVGAAVTLTLVFTGHRLAPMFGAVFGIFHGSGIAAVHWLPHWSVLSDSFVSASAPLVSWTAVTLQVAGAFGVAAGGMAVLGASRSERTALRSGAEARA